MRKVEAFVFKCLFLMGFLNFLGGSSSGMGMGMGMGVEEMKAEAGIPVTRESPPEGNTTFNEGRTWCVAAAGVSQLDLQNALDWACGVGMADCTPIQLGGECYDPDTLLSHASFAFNTYYQQNGNSDIACNFGGTATLTKNNPSYGKCSYAAPGSVASTATVLSKPNSTFLWWEIGGVLLQLLLLYKRS